MPYVVVMQQLKQFLIEDQYVPLTATTAVRRKTSSVEQILVILNTLSLRCFQIGPLSSVTRKYLGAKFLGTAFTFRYVTVLHKIQIWLFQVLALQRTTKTKVS